MSIKTEDIRVLFRRNNQRVFGPLGCFEIGQRLWVDNDEWMVTSIDHDGAGVAHRISFLKDLKAERQCEAKDVMKSLSTVRMCPHPSFYFVDYERIERMMERQCEANRARYAA